MRHVQSDGVGPRTQDHWLTPVLNVQGAHVVGALSSLVGQFRRNLPGDERLPLGERPVVLVPRLSGGEQLLAPELERHAVAVEVVRRLLPRPRSIRH